MTNDSAIWTEKYRPHQFSDMKGQKEIVRKAKAFVSNKNMPHLLFSGPAGIGKTTLALIIARQLFKETWHANLLELNASDERGIDVIRVKVKDFARTKSLGDVPFKIIYLDECDALTKEAQQALRRTMENYTTTCRFILSCNYASKIIDPIQSRCTVFRFKPLAADEMIDIIEHIIKTEKIHIDKAAKEALIEVCDGDVRRMENVLQSCAAVSETVTAKDIYAMAGVAEPKEIQQALTASAKGDFPVAKKAMLDAMLNYGLSGTDVIKQIQKEIWNLDVKDHQKLSMTRACGETEFRLVEGSDEFIQIEALLSSFCLICTQPIS
ncbi:MAG: replication factor C small subunit [Nanoarchaeota archaeon]